MRTHHDGAHYMQLRNNLRRAQWAISWLQQGGSSHWKARDLKDLRNLDDLAIWRPVQYRIFRARQELARARRAKARPNKRTTTSRLTVLTSEIS